LSYDFHLIVLDRGEDVPRALERAQEREEERSESDALDVTPAEADRVTQVGEALRQHAPWLDADLVDEAGGVQIMVEGHMSYVHVAYWHEDEEKACDVLERVWKALQTMKTAGGYEIFDPQIDRRLDLDADFDEVLAAYSGVMERIPQAMAQSREGKTRNKPWWRFW